MTLEMRNGSRIVPRMTVDLISRCISTASPTARSVWKTMFSNTYSSVTTSAFQNSLSLAILTKLSKPMKCGAPSRL